MKPWPQAIAVGLSCLATGCSNSSFFADAERALDTDGYYHALDHISAYYPSGIALNFPGYVIAFEESPIHLVTRGPRDLRLNEAAHTSGYTVDRLLNALQFDVQYVSQIMRYEGRPYGDGNCSLYSLYYNHGTAVVAPCSDDPRNGAARANEFASAFIRSWDALDILQERLAEDIVANEYTHLVVGIMGLDTAQEEAIRNYRSIISSVRKNAGEAFKPLFVGVTWPSFYANRWFDPLWEALAYSPIADRADTLGLTWLGILLNEVIAPLGEHIEVTVITHSFGARAATMALCVGPVIARDPDDPVRRRGEAGIENFIGLAAAFSVKRFGRPDNPFYEDIYYRDYCPQIRRFMFTASSNDRAFLPVFWSKSVGDHEFMLEFCAQQRPIRVSCTLATAKGEIGDFDVAAKIIYVDTSELMKYTMPGTEGKGHSDIYRPEAGRLLWTLISGGSS